MAQEPVDQKKLFVQTMLIAMVIWLLLLMGWSYFARPPVSDKKPEELVAEVQKLRADKDYVEAVRRCHELSSRFQGTEYGALGLLLEARIYYEDKKDSHEAFNALRRLEEFYSHTQVYRTQGRTLQEKVEREIDGHNRQFLSYQIIHRLVSLFGRSDASYVLAILTIAVLVRLLLLPLEQAVRQHAQDGANRAEIAGAAGEICGRRADAPPDGFIQAVRHQSHVGLPLRPAAHPLPHLGLQYDPALSGAVQAGAFPVD